MYFYDIRGCKPCKIDKDMYFSVNGYNTDAIEVFHEWINSLQSIEWLELSCGPDKEYKVSDIRSIYAADDESVTIETIDGVFRELDYIKITACGNTSGDWYEELGTLDLVAINGDYPIYW